LIVDSGYVYNTAINGGRLGVFAYNQTGAIWSNLQYSCTEIWLPTLLTLSQPDEGYGNSSKVSCTLNLISTFSAHILKDKKYTKYIGTSQYSCTEG
jgi:hypothetical protein